jgi:hypothetical protein
MPKNGSKRLWTPIFLIGPNHYNGPTSQFLQFFHLESDNIDEKLYHDRFWVIPPHLGRILVPKILLQDVRKIFIYLLPGEPFLFHYYIWADFSTKIFHASTSFIIFLKRAGFSWIFPRKFITISMEILI